LHRFDTALECDRRTLPNALVSSQSGEKFQDQAFCIHVKRMILTKMVTDSWQGANEMVKKMP